MVSRRDGSGGPPTVPAHQPVGTFVPFRATRRPTGDPDLGPLPDWWALLHGDTNSSGLGYETASAPLSKAVLATDLLPWCYGQVRVSVPAIMYETMFPGSSSWQEGQVLVPWSEGPIQSVDAVYCQGLTVRAGFANDGYQTFDRLDFTGVAGELNGYIGGYFDASLGRLAVANRVAGTYLHVKITAGYPYANTGWWTVFGGLEAGELEFAADIHGLKIYDPRKDSTSVGYDVSLGVSSHRENDETTWAYSTCPPLIARDLARRAAKMNSSTIDDASIGTAATASDNAGFSCSIAFTKKTTLENALAVVLQTCNGFVINANGKFGIFVDVANASPAVASLSEANGDAWDLNYEWLSARDRYTQMAVSFQNKDAAYKDDQTPWFGNPASFSSEATKTITGVNAGTDVITLASSPGWAIGNTVIFFQNGGAAIAGLSDGQTYYVKTISGADVTLSAVSGGAVVNLTGTPTITTQYLQRIGSAYPPTVPVKQQVVHVPGVNTLAAAVILRDYLYNVNAVTFRISGALNSRGILLQQGHKITLTTLKLASADYLIQQITGDANGFFQVVLRPYLASVYGSTPITHAPPVIPPTGTGPDVPPPPAAARVSVLSDGIAFDAPRVYTVTGPYGAGGWTIVSGSGTASKIDDGDATTVAVTTGSAMELKLDRGVVPAVVFGRLNLWLNMDLAVLKQYGYFNVSYSDDDITYYNALSYATGDVGSDSYVTPWQDAPVGGIYPTHIEICDAIGAHRYWKIYLSQVGGTLNLYEAQFETYTAYAGSTIGYELVPWPGYVYDGAFPGDMGNYETPNANLAALATRSTLPTDAAAWEGVKGLVSTVTGNIYTSQTTAIRFAVRTVGATARGAAGPGSQVVTVAASYTAPSLNGINLGAVTLYAGTNVTITPGSPTANDITIAASGGGGTMTKLRNGSGITGTINDSNTSFTTSANVAAATGGYFVVVDGIIDLAATWVGTTLTPSSAPHSGIAVIYWS